MRRRVVHGVGLRNTQWQHKQTKSPCHNWVYFVCLFLFFFSFLFASAAEFCRCVDRSGQKVSSTPSLGGWRQYWPDKSNLFLIELFLVFVFCFFFRVAWRATVRTRDGQSTCPLAARLITIIDDITINYPDTVESCIQLPTRHKVEGKKTTKKDENGGSFEVAITESGALG